MAALLWSHPNTGFSFFFFRSVDCVSEMCLRRNKLRDSKWLDFSEAQKQLKSCGRQCSLVDYKTGTNETFSGIPLLRKVLLFSHTRDNIYIIPWRCEDFLVLARFFPFVSLSIYQREEKTDWACLTDTHRAKRTPMCTQAEPLKCAALVLSPL